jgi:hydroxymethylpyrimidine pyrophosphatase-like HAD family hydrolase
LVPYPREKYPGFNAVHYSDVVCETQALGVTKGTAARYLADRLGRGTLVCVGDSPNDIEMLQEADYAFVAADGKESVRSMGFTLAAPCTEGTVADAIRKLRAILTEKQA